MKEYEWLKNLYENKSIGLSQLVSELILLHSRKKLELDEIGAMAKLFQTKLWEEKNINED